jgi:hypothetical protein
MAHDSAGGGQTVRLGLAVDVAPQRTTLHPGTAAGRIDAHGPHRREVDDDPVVANGGARHVVASAPYGDVQIVVAGETHRRNHVGDADASGDQARAPVDGTVPDCTGGVVVGVAGTDQPAPEPVHLHDGWLVAPAPDFRGRWCRHRGLLFRWPHRTTADRDGKVKNLDFTTGKACATLAS